MQQAASKSKGTVLIKIPIIYGILRTVSEEDGKGVSHNRNYILGFKSSLVNHGLFVYLVATLPNKVKQLLQVHRPRVKNVIAVFASLEGHNTHRPIDLCYEGF